MKKYSAALFMLGLGILCLAIHFWLGWQAYISEQQDHQASATLSSYVVEWGRDVFENLQSEFLQLFFQFMLLAGAFEFLRIQAYEKDEEEVKEQLERIESLLIQHGERTA